METTTTTHIDAFPSLQEAFDFISNTINTVGGSTVQLLVGSTAWPEPRRRYRVTVTTKDGIKTEAT